MQLNPLFATQRGMPASWLISYLRDHGIDRAEICRAVDVDETSLISNSGIMRTPLYLQVFNWASKRLENAVLGVDIAESINEREFGILGHLVLNGSSLRESFKFLERYHCIFSPDFEYKFTYEGGRAQCHYAEADIPGADSTQDINFGLSLITRAIRERAGQSWKPIRVCFTYPQPDDASRHSKHFGDMICFDQAINLLEYEDEVVDIPSTNADANLLPILLAQANKLLDEQQIKTDIVKQVRLQVTTSIGYRPVTSETTARRLNMSVRQLQRQLEARHTSFRQIKDETLVRIAKDALASSELSITEIAMKLSYSETSAFDRMFKKKVGVSPLQYRKQNTL